VIATNSITKEQTTHNVHKFAISKYAEIYVWNDKNCKN